MWRCAVLVVVVVGACSKGSGPPVNNAASDAVATKVPCPSDDEVADRLRAHWSVPADQAIHVACTPGRFPDAGWAVAAIVDINDDESWERTAVLAAADGALLAQDERIDMAPWYRAELGEPTPYQTMDFDGDGVDELVQQTSVGHGGSQVTILDVAKLSGPALVEALGLETHYDNGGAAEEERDLVECNVDTTFIGEGPIIVIRAIGTITTERPDPPEDCWTGTRTYRLVGNAFVSE